MLVVLLFDFVEVLLLPLSCCCCSVVVVVNWMEGVKTKEWAAKK